MNNQTHIVVDNVVTGNTALVIVGLAILGAATIIGAGIYGAAKLTSKVKVDLISDRVNKKIKEMSREI